MGERPRKHRSDGLIERLKRTKKSERGAQGSRERGTTMTRASPLLLFAFSWTDTRVRLWEELTHIQVTRHGLRSGTRATRWAPRRSRLRSRARAPIRGAVAQWQLQQPGKTQPALHHALPRDQAGPTDAHATNRTGTLPTSETASEEQACRVWIVVEAY